MRTALKWFVVGFLFIAGGLTALALTIPHNFSSGTTISAAQVNANFAAVEAAVDALTATVGNIQSGTRVFTGGSTTSTTPAQMASFNVAVPAAGTLTVIVSGQTWLDMDATTAASLTSHGRLGLCDTTASSAECGGTWWDHWVQDADNTTAQNESHTFAISRTVAVTGPGTRTFFLNGQTWSSSWEFHLYGPVHATAIFIPGGGLTITSDDVVPIAPAEQPGGN